jgi:hypothetical protein
MARIVTATSVTTPEGTTVSLEQHDGITEVVLAHPDAPADLQHKVAGRVTEGSFQPIMFCQFAMRPAVLRAIADLIDTL